MDVKFEHYAKASNLQSEPVLLWENASPTSEFSGGVSLPKEYDSYMIEYRFSTTDASAGITYYNPNANDGTAGSFSTAGVKYMATNMYSAGRLITLGGDGIPFGQGFYSYVTYRPAGTSGGEAGYGYGIPTRIWGVNFAL